MSRWAHVMCADCWERKHPERKPLVLAIPEQGTCCFCGSGTEAGIFVREDPALLQCQGNHGGEE